MSDEPKFIDGMRLTAEPKADRLVDGLMLKKPHDKSPDFVKAKGSINLSHSASGWSNTKSKRLITSGSTL